MLAQQQALAAQELETQQNLKVRPRLSIFSSSLPRLSHPFFRTCPRTAPLLVHPLSAARTNLCGVYRQVLVACLAVQLSYPVRSTMHVVHDCTDAELLLCVSFSHTHTTTTTTTCAVHGLQQAFQLYQFIRNPPAV